MSSDRRMQNLERPCAALFDFSPAYASAKKHEGDFYFFLRFNALKFTRKA
jgi:hypothetical protein